MREAYLADEEDPLDGFEFLTMAEAGEVGHWSIVAKLNEKAGTASSQAHRLGAADPAAPPRGGPDASLKLAADEDPDEEA